MAERRQAHRREPIEIEVRERVLEARPLPWTKRNDLGNEIMSQYSDILNSSLRSYTNPETQAPELKVYLSDKILDPGVIVRLGYPHVEDPEFFDELDYPEILDLIYASLDVNELQSIRDLVDPNALAPIEPGGTSSSGTESPASETQSQPSTPDSDSQDSVEMTPSTSPTPSSSTSSTKEIDPSGTSDGGS